MPTLRRSKRAQKKRKVEADVKVEVEEAAIDTSQIPEWQPMQYKDDSDAFNTPVEDGKDYISGIPSEMLDNILSYCVLDHEPEAAANSFREGLSYRPRPHVLLSLAAMSKHFRVHVESFCHREMIKHKDDYFFRTSEELDAIRNRRQTRRSPRLKMKPPEDRRCYRLELVRHNYFWCIYCNGWDTQMAVMANTVGCCRLCQPLAFGATINLTDALKQYDLRDWMLLPDREPGPRTKKIELPTITYGTVRVPRRFMSGWMISYRFFQKDVEAIAKIVHGDVESHMEAKRKQRVERKVKRIRETHRKLKLRHHRDELKDTRSKIEKLHHQKRIEHYESPEWDSDDDSAADESGYGYGHYGDEHEQFCFDKAHCDLCWDKDYQKYCPWW